MNYFNGPHYPPHDSPEAYQTRKERMAENRLLALEAETARLQKALAALTAWAEHVNGEDV